MTEKASHSAPSPDDELDPQMQANLRAAQAYRGRPADQRLVPYRSVAHLLEMRASETPATIFLIHYDAQGEREVLTYGEFNVRVNRTANLLTDVLGVRAGDRVATIAYNH